MSGQEKGRNLTYLGLQLGQFSQAVQVRIVTVGFLIGWVLYGIIQERVMKVDRFPYAWSLTFFQVIIYSALGSLESWRDRDTRPADQPKAKSWPTEQKQQLHLMALLGLSAIELVLHRGLGNLSFSYLSFSMKVMFQSAKILPVILVGVLFFHKSYALHNYLAALFISLGIAVFSGPFDSSGSDSGDDDGFLIGAGLMTIVLLSEATKPNLWKATFEAAQLYDVDLSQSRLVAMLNGLGLLILVPVLFLTGEGVDGIVFLWENPRYWLSVSGIFLLGYAAQISSVTHVRLTDPLTNSILSSSRKLLSIVLSFIWYGRWPSSWNVAGFLVFALGLIVSTYGDAQKQQVKATKH